MSNTETAVLSPTIADDTTGLPAGADPATPMTAAVPAPPALPAPPAPPNEFAVASAGTPTVARTDGAFAITSFVLGIVSIIGGWTFIAPIVGLIFGVLALRRKTSERTLALWGVWLNGAILALMILAGVAMLALFGLGLIASLPYGFN